MNIINFIADREVQRILLELLNQMDGFDQTVNVKVGMYYNGKGYLLIYVHTYVTFGKLMISINLVFIIIGNYGHKSS